MAATQMLAGFHAVIARLRQAPESIREVYVEAQRRDKRMQALIATATQAGRAVHPVSADRLDGLTGGSRHQGVVAVADVRKLADDLDEVLDGVQGPALLLILDGVTDPHNLGACLRTADAAGVHAVAHLSRQWQHLGQARHRRLTMCRSRSTHPAHDRPAASQRA